MKQFNDWTIETSGPYRGRTIRLLTPIQFCGLPDGEELVSIGGISKIKGHDSIDQDTRGGYLAWGKLLPTGET